MKKNKKWVSVILMLAGLGFSTSSFAVVDCEGLKEHNGKSGSGFSKYMQGPSSYEQCLTFNEKGYTWDYVDKITGEIRKQNQQWDGVRRYKEKQN